MQCLNVKISEINEARYNKLNKKLELRTKHKHHTDQNNKTNTNTFYTRIKNLSNIKFNKEALDILETGLNYAFESQPEHFIRDLIIDTENAIQHVDNNLHNTYRFLTGQRIKQIMTSNTLNILHKTKMHIAKRIRNKIIQHNLTIAKADKGKTNTIIDKNSYRHKVLEFLQDNHYERLQKDPTDLYHKQTRNAMQDSNLIIDTHEEMSNTNKTICSQAKCLKLHKDKEPIRPVVNDIQAPTYKVSKFLKNG
jgi:hypothetical protein